MDARFHELAADEREQRTKRRAGAMAWVILFLSVFLGVYGGFSIALEISLSGRFGKFISQYSTLIVVLLTLFSGWPAIIHYRMRSLFPVRCLSFLAFASAIVLTVSPLYQGFVNHPLFQSSFGKWLCITTGILMSVVYMKFSALRARYLYSAKTDQWLRCHVSKKRPVLNQENTPSETIDEILTLDAVKATRRDRRRGVSALTLFLDTEPDGEHYLWYTVTPKKQSFFSLKFSRPKSAPVLIPLDWEEVGAIRARFGEFKKTFSIPIASAIAGDLLRKRASSASAPERRHPGE